MNTVQMGRKGETIVAKYLQRQDYTILERNWYCKYGELDIVVSRNGVLTFVEVKLRSSHYKHTIISKYKIQRLRKAIYIYLGDSEKPWRLEAFYIFYTNSGVSLRNVLITKSY